MSPAPSRPALRRVLEQVLRTSSDLSAFCIDFFPAVERRFSSGMDRLERVNLLFVQVDTQDIWDALCAAYPSEVRRVMERTDEQAASFASIKPDGSADREPALSCDRNDLYDALVSLLPLQFKEVLFRLDLRAASLPPESAPQIERAIAVIRELEQDRSGLQRLAQVIQRVKQYTPR